MRTEELVRSKISKELTGSRTRDLSSCGKLLQPSAAFCKKGLTKVL